MTCEIDLTGDVTLRDLLLDAAEWRLIGLLLERPASDWPAPVSAMATQVRDASLRRAAELAQTQASAGLYDTTFGPGGPAAPREVSHRATLEPGSFLAELHAYYEAFDYHAATDDPADHVAVQVGFVGYLRLKQLYAQARGQSEQAVVARDAAESFIAEHLRLVAAPLTKSLEHSGIEYLHLAAEALLERVGRPSVTPGISLPQFSDDVNDPDAAFPCGG